MRCVYDYQLYGCNKVSAIKCNEQFRMWKVSDEIRIHGELCVWYSQDKLHSIETTRLRLCILKKPPRFWTRTGCDGHKPNYSLWKKPLRQTTTTMNKETKTRSTYYMYTRFELGSTDIRCHVIGMDRGERFLHGHFSSPSALPTRFFLCLVFRLNTN